MFVRKRKNKSGSTSVVVIDKSSGKPKELVCVGVSTDDEEIKALVSKGKEWIMRYHCIRHDKRDSTDPGQGVPNTCGRAPCS